VFIGHFALAFAAKPAAPRASLGTLILAAQFLDALWPIFVLTGIERVEIAPGDTAFTPLAFVSYPYSHSLLATLVWAALFAGVYLALRRDRRGAWVVAVLVASHWLLDAATHRPDLPLAPGGGSLIGLGLWNSVPATLAIEGALFAVGLGLYLARTRSRDRTGSASLWALVIVLLLAYFGAAFGPLPPSPQAVAWSGLAGWLIVAWGYWIDRHRDMTVIEATS
jgi:hypothetical protein